MLLPLCTASVLMSGLHYEDLEMRTKRRLLGGERELHTKYLMIHTKNMLF